MEIKIEGNPGTGNHYTEVNIGHIENNFPNVKEVKIIKAADGTKTVTTSDQDIPAVSTSASPVPLTTKQTLKEAVRADILKYVANILPLINYSWKDKYMKLWDDILNIPEVDATIYNKGRQQHTSFNRKEVLHIICYLGKHAAGGIGIFEESYNASKVALQLNDGCELSTRPELGYTPSKNIKEAINNLMNSKKYLSAPQRQ